MVLTWTWTSQLFQGNSSFWTAPELLIKEIIDFPKDVGWGAHACMHACMYSCMHSCIHALHACMHAYIHTFIHACMYACMYACMSVWKAHTHTHRGGGEEIPNPNPCPQRGEASPPTSTGRTGGTLTMAWEGAGGASDPWDIYIYIYVYICVTPTISGLFLLFFEDPAIVTSWYGGPPQRKP